MNKDIKDIVEYLGIPELKKENESQKEKLFKMEREMAKLTFDRTVGLYARYLDEIEYIISKIKKYNIIGDKNIYSKLKDLDKKAIELQSNPEVMKYDKLRNDYYKYKYNNDYYIAVNLYLREELSKLGVPNIYVQLDEFFYKANIVNGVPLGENFLETKPYIITPVYNMTSNRDFRHFYNRVSYKYLEKLCEDYSFDLEGKNLGKVRIKKVK